MAIQTSLRQLNGKFMEEKLKKGYGTSYFVKFFGLEEDAFIALLKKTFSAKSFVQYCTRLKKNDKILKRHSNSATDEDDTIEAVEIAKATVAVKTAETVETAKATEPVKTAEPTLEDLKAQEEALKEIVQSEECAHAKCISQRAELKARFRLQREKLVSLTKQLTEIQAEFDFTYAKWNKLGDYMANITEYLANYRQSLSEIREKISNLEKINIFIYSSGEIEVESPNKFDYTCDPAEVSKVFDSLIQNEKAENFALKVIRQLARTIVITRNMHDSNVKFEITFEDEALQEVFYSFN